MFFRFVVPAFLFLFAYASPAVFSAEDSEKDGPEAADVAAEFRKHCVQVYLRAKTADGEAPTLGEFADDIANLRPSRFGGYWWSRRMVLLEDPGLDDRFIHSIEIAVPDGGGRWPARLAGRFVKLQAILVEVLPDEDGLLPDATPLVFVDKPYDPDHVVCAYSWTGDEWAVTVGGGVGPHSFTDGGMETVEVDTEGVMINDDLEAVGVAFGDSLRFAAGELYWYGSGVGKSEAVTAESYRRLQDALSERLRGAVLETRITLRAEIDEDFAASSLDDDDVDESTSEIRVPGFVSGPRMLLIPVKLNAAGIARIESIRIVLPDGETVEAEFAGAIREYMAIAARTDRDMCRPERLPAGFSFLNPMLIPEEAFLPGDEFLALPERGLFLRQTIDYELGRRRETRDYDRWLGIFRGFGDAPLVLTRTNEDNGAMAFDLDGKLLALALVPRVPHSDYSQKASRQAGFRPLGYVHEVLTRLDAVDPTLAPIEAEKGKRLIAVGVEWQGMSADTARLFGAAKPTRGGEIGLLVSHVYPGSVAERLGLREQDILLRLRVEGQNEPIELIADDSHMLGFSLLDLEDMSVESVQRYMANMPPPWPSRENNLTRILTAIGYGRGIVLEYLREGEPMRGEFTTSYSPSDYAGAPRFVVKELGITVKPITYEVAAYFRRPENSGVIISKVEDGGRGSVAGLYQYLMIVRVNGEPVADFAEFQAKIRPFENGDDDRIELTVEGFGKTRLVKIAR